MEERSDSKPKQKPSTKLTRDSLVSVVGAVKNDEDQGNAWNIVEMLEVLIDGGHFKLARALAERVAAMVAGDGRERLFAAYKILCQLMSEGDQREALAGLEKLYIEINSSGHSQADRVRIALILSRALALCVGVGSLPQGAIIRARQVLGIELANLGRSKDRDLACQVSVELAKTYLYAPTPDPLAARLILRDFAEDNGLNDLSKQSAFDLNRALFQAERAIGDDKTKKITEESLRQEAQALGGVARALVELALCRGRADFDRERLAGALDVFIENEFLSGAFEASFILASEALDRGHNVVSRRLWSRCVAAANESGFLHGSLLAGMGMFQCEMSGGDFKLAREWARNVSNQLGSDLALGSAGLNLAAACQMLGDFERAREVAERCRRFFRENRLPGFQAQAAHIIALCRAREGAWKFAAKLWGEAVELDDQRHALMLSAERRVLLAQAELMSDVGGGGALRASTGKKVERIIVAAEDDLRVFSGDPEARRLQARLKALRAHVSVVQEEHVRALKHLSDARGIFESLQAHYEVAMNDAFTGLSMLAIGKSGNSSLLEEAVLNFQRSLQFFSAGSNSAIRWKLLYYMAVCAVIIGQSRFTDEDKIKWRELAASWLRGAEKELDQVPENESIEATDPEYAGFSPGLKRQALDELKNALGMNGKKRKRPDKGSKPEVTAPDGYLH
jgi:tetratricopeptide (TPR) repeat protein